MRSNSAKPHTGAGGLDRRAIMRDARRRYLSRQRPGEIALPWAECLRRAWQAARIRKGDDTAATMNRIAIMIEEHLSRRIILPPAIPRDANATSGSFGPNVVLA